MTAVLRRYGEVLDSLRTLGKQPGVADSKASNLVKAFESPATLLVIKMAHSAALKLEGLNEVLQAQQYTASEMHNAVSVANNGLQEMRTEKEFSKMVGEVRQKVGGCEMSKLKALDLNNAFQVHWTSVGACSDKR